MNISLTLPETVAHHMLEICNTKLPEAKLKAEAAQREYEELLLTKSTLEKSLREYSPEHKMNGEEQRSSQSETTTPPINVDVSYNQQWSNLKKSMFIIYTSGKKALSTKQVVDTIIEKFEPEKKTERAKMVGNISSVLGTAAKDGKLRKIVNELDENLYSLPSDFDFKTYFSTQPVFNSSMQKT